MFVVFQSHRDNILKRHREIFDFYQQIINDFVEITRLNIFIEKFRHKINEIIIREFQNLKKNENR